MFREEEAWGTSGSASQDQRFFKKPVQPPKFGAIQRTWKCQESHLRVHRSDLTAFFSSLVTQSLGFRVI